MRSVAAVVSINVVKHNYKHACNCMMVVKVERGVRGEGEGRRYIGTDGGKDKHEKSELFYLLGFRTWVLRVHPFGACTCTVCSAPAWRVFLCIQESRLAH